MDTQDQPRVRHITAFMMNAPRPLFRPGQVVATPGAIAALKAAHDDVELYCAAVDQGLNDKGYIVPGLGDAGDKIFGTK